MNVQELMQHPEYLDRETLFELRQMIAVYPYYQPARLLMLKNLYIMHDPAFEEELRRASIYFTDRRVLFDLVEQSHYRLKRRSHQSLGTGIVRTPAQQAIDNSRNASLIDDFLSSRVDAEESAVASKGSRKHRKPTAADATVDYIAYLLSTDFEELDSLDSSGDTSESPSRDSAKGGETEMKGGDLIDAFINNEGGRFNLQDDPDYVPPKVEKPEPEPEPEADDDIVTETLAGIYIKQGRYEKALDIMQRLNEKPGKKNLYYDDQKRFLEKLIANKAKQKK